MPWTLDVATIDVGVGESAVVVAQNVLAGQQRVMLIDGGLANQGTVVNTFLANNIGNNAVDHILVTHYDVDHSGGIIALLGADNLYAICDMIAVSALNQAYGGTNRPEIIAAAAAGACAAFLGAYNIIGGANCSAQAIMAAFSARAQVGPGTNDANAALWGMQEAEAIVTGPVLNPRLIPANSTLSRRTASQNIGIACANAITAGGNIQASVRNTVFNQIRARVANTNCRFLTGGRFSATSLIDTGGANMPADYALLAAGQIMMGNTYIQAPGINRLRTTPALGDEVLWNSGVNAMQAPAGSPMLYVMACNAYVWNAPPNDVPLALAIDNNNDSFGLILRFNNFFFYTGGDLIAAGEDLIATAVTTIGLPDPAGGAFAPAARIAAFKCGHHGADTCTSAAFLTTGLQRGAIISCGAKYGHPFQSVIDRLHGAATLRYFYLTGCSYYRNYIPATYTPQQDQLLAVGNKSRVAGGFAVPPGNIFLQITEAESTSTSIAYPLNGGDTALRQFSVTYYDYDTPQAFRTETNVF